MAVTYEAKIQLGDGHWRHVDVTAVVGRLRDAIEFAQCKCDCIEPDECPLCHDVTLALDDVLASD